MEQSLTLGMVLYNRGGVGGSKVEVTKDTIEHIAELARLDLTDNEKEELVLKWKSYHILIN